MNMRMQQDNNAGDRSISRRGRKKKGVIETLSHLRNDRSKLTKICQESSVDANNYTRSVIEDEWNDSGFSVYDPSNDDGNGKEEERDNPSVTTATVRGMDGTGVSNGSPNTASIAGHIMAELEDEITKRTATFMTNEEERKESLLRKKLLDKKKNDNGVAMATVIAILPLPVVLARCATSLEGGSLRRRRRRRIAKIPNQHHRHLVATIVR